MIGKRKRWPVSLWLTIITAALLWACSSAARLPPLPGGAVILAFGDSLTFGTGAAPAESYPAVLERLVGRRVVNAGVPGETAGQGLSRLPELLAREKPALLILCHGGNDLIRRMNQQETANHLRAMVRLAKERGVAVLLLAVPSLGLSLSPPRFYREVADEADLPIEEEALPLILADGSLKSDFIHPNAAGYRRLAESVAALLKKCGAVE